MLNSLTSKMQLVAQPSVAAAASACEDRFRMNPSQERPEALLRKGVTDIRTASAPNSIKATVDRGGTIPESLRTRWFYLLASPRTRRLLAGVWKLQATYLTLAALLQVRKQKNKSWKLQDNQLQHCPWNCGLIGGGIEMVGLDVTGSPSVFNKYRSPGALKVPTCSSNRQSPSLSAASMTLLDVLDIVPGLIKSLPREQWGQSACIHCIRPVGQN
ncbi:hypothetical protein WJX79_007757 [Trebouxia sp. C0005]